MITGAGTAKKLFSLPEESVAPHGIGKKFPLDMHTGTGDLALLLPSPPSRNIEAVLSHESLGRQPTGSVGYRRYGPLNL